MKSSDVSRAMSAAISTATELDLPADDAIVLQNSNKVALRLLPCDVFARVAHAGQEVAAFEVDLARRLTGTGSPVAALEPRVEPRVYERDGFAMTLWTYYEPETLQDDVSPADYALALERLHEGMRRLDVADAALHGSSRGGARARREPRPHTRARRPGPRASDRHPPRRATRGRRQRRGRAAAARRATSRERPQHTATGWCSSTSRRVAVGRSNSTWPMRPRT